MALKVRVLEKYCKGCGYCIQFCPEKGAQQAKEERSGAFVPVMRHQRMYRLRYLRNDVSRYSA